MLLGPKLVEPPAGPRENLYVIEELAKRLGVGHLPGFGMTAREHVDIILSKAGLGTFDTFREDRWVDLQPEFDTAHFVRGFAHKDGKFRFRPDWAGQIAPNRPPKSMGLLGPAQALPEFPEHVDLIEVADAAHPFRLATSPARSFLNSSFTETPGSLKREGRPELIIHPDDAADIGIDEGVRVEVGNQRGELILHARLLATARRGVVIAEGIWPNSAHERGEGINILVGADQAAPFGGAAFHDTKVWVRNAA